MGGNVICCRTGMGEYMIERVTGIILFFVVLVTISACLGLWGKKRVGTRSQSGQHDATLCVQS